MSEKTYEVYDFRDKAILFRGTESECINYIDTETTIGESEHVWYREVTE